MDSWLGEWIGDWSGQSDVTPTPESGDWCDSWNGAWVGNWLGVAGDASPVVVSVPGCASIVARANEIELEEVDGSASLRLDSPTIETSHSQCEDC